MIQKISHFRFQGMLIIQIVLVAFSFSVKASPSSFASALSESPLVRLLTPSTNKFEGVDPNLVLFESIEHNNITLIKRALESGANPNMHNQDHLSPLLLSVSFEHLEAMSLLLEFGARVDAALSDGTTALMMAVQLENKALFDHLVLYNADVLLSAKDGSKPLSVAASFKLSDFVKSLARLDTSKEADLYHRDTALDKVAGQFSSIWDDMLNEGASLVDYLSLRGDEDLVEILQEEGFKSPQDLSSHDSLMSCLSVESSKI